MTEFTAEDRKILVEIHTVLMGTNGFPGLCKDFEEHKKSDTKFRGVFYTFRLWGIICLVLLATAVGISVPEIIKAFILKGG
jgi:hypothetical protein